MFQHILKSALAIIAFFIAVLSLLLFYDFLKPRKESEPIKKPQFDLTLNEIIRLDWTTQLTDIPKIFPGSKIKRQDPKKRTLAFYSIKARLTDIDEIADLVFYQNEEYIRGVSKDAFNLRKLTFECKSIDEQTIKFEFLCRSVKSLEYEVYTLSNPTHVDASYSIYDPDKKGGINIDIEKDTLISKCSVIMTITRFEVRKTLQPK